jgi:hypothetical protein
LFTYGIIVPGNDAGTKVTIPTSLQEAYQLFIDTAGNGGNGGNRGHGRNDSN